MYASLKLLGPFALLIDGREARLSRKAEALLALLARHRGKSQTRETLADMLWTDRSADEARHSLRQCLWTIRKATGLDVIKAHRDRVHLAPDMLTADVDEFESLAASQESAELARAVALYRGEFLAGFPSASPRFDEWLALERECLTDLAAAALRSLADARRAGGDVEGATAAGRRLIALDDLNEESHRLLITILVQAGRRAEALRQYAICAETLRRELGVEPEPRTAELARLARTERLPLATGPSPVTVADAAAEPPSPPTVSDLGRRARSTRVFVGVALVACCVAAGAVGVAALHRTSPPPSNDIVIFPFVNTSSIAAEAAPIAGITDLISDALATRYSLRVASYPADRSHVSSRYRIEGSASFSSTLEVSARVSDRGGAGELWSDRYDVPRSHVTAVVDDIVSHVARAAGDDPALHGVPGSPPPRSPQRAENLLALANYVRYRTDKDSNGVFREIVARVATDYPDNADALAMLANADLTDFAAHPAADKLVVARDHLDRALDLDPANITALWGRCFLLRMWDRPGAALDVCRRALAVNPHHPGTLREIAQDLLALGDPADAAGWFRAAITAGPNQIYVGAAYAGLADCELASGRIDTAVGMLRQGMQHDYWGNVAGLLLAAALETSGRHDEAKEALTEFFQHHPEYPATRGIPPNLRVEAAPRSDIIFAALQRLGIDQTEPADP